MTTTTDTNRYGLRAPRGGCTVGGKLYRGGQFCKPFDPANPHGVEVVPVVVSKPAARKIEIAGTSYATRQVPAGECGTIAYEMHKLGTDQTYCVILNYFNEVTCDCGDFEFRKSGTAQLCKHGRAMVNLGLISPKPAPMPVPAPLPVPAPKPVVPTYSRSRRFDPSAEDFHLAAEMFAR